MIDGKTCLGVVVARGGSKGLPGKNIADLAGRPLVAWSVAAAKASAYLDRTILSSDDQAIIAAAQNAGCDVPFLRPSALAADDSPVSDALIHALDNLDQEFDYVVLLAATSPLRNAADIDACISACHSGAVSAVSVTETATPPEWICRLDAGRRLVPVIPGDGLCHRRQDYSPAYLPNGAVYVARVDWFRHHMTFYGADTIASIMPAERAIDIDGEFDLMMARFLVGDAATSTEGTPAP
ncbi:MAG TPA: acylneuraminate cytidylyltransferase [Rhodospirillaceae bacterium]|nr:acylneuraminate cytidylyltransferase [Rhodospirillaceae bacterium]|tara:strand:+ start:14870 stop:15586 length:717 start_codon:yes stop_codon:yes gene_type:complete